MKRRIFACVLACMMILSAFPFAVFAEDAVCPGITNGHKKSNCSAYTLVEVVDAKCGEQGYTIYKCDTCGKKFADDFTNIEGEHEWEETTAAVDATCEAVGTTAIYTCSKCGATKGGDEIAKADHTWTVVSDTTGDGCPGYKEEKCSVCEATRTTQVDLDGDNRHNWSDAPIAIKVEPTCKNPGVAVYECKDCKVTKEITIVATDCLKETLTAHAAVAPTCTEDGNIAYWTCDVCGSYYEDENGTLLTKAADVVLNALGHDSIVLDRKEASCFEAGYIKYECRRCGLIETVVLPELLHPNRTSIDVPATCDKYGYTLSECLDCGYTWEHDPVDPLGCTDYEDPLSVNEVVLEAMTCESHGKVSWDCGRCGKNHTKVIEKTGHKEVTVIVDATCTAGTYTFTYCSNAHCNLPLITTYTDAETGRVFDVAVNGMAVRFMKMVSFDDVLSETNHTWGESIVYDATCTEPGKKIVYCKVCDKRDENVVIPAKGHKASVAWIIDVPATCTTEGHKYSACVRCGVVMEEAVIDAPGHNWVKGTVVLPTCQSNGYTNYKCSACGLTKQDDEVVWTGSLQDEPATWDNTSVKWFYESRAEAEADGHVGLCTDADRTIYRDGHCTLAGLYSYACSGCNTNVLVRIPGTGYGHQYVETVPGLDATCTTDGYTAVQECTVCNHVIPSKKIDALGHNYVTDAAVEPTCENTGLTEGSHCTRCGDVKVAQTVIPAKGHTYGDLIAKVEPTCTTAGSVAHYVCEVCNKTFDENYAEITDLVIPATGHNVRIVDERVADCVNYGYKHFDCPNCDIINEGNVLIDYIEDYVAAIGHNYVKNDVLSTAPTCDVAGSDVSICTNCGAQVTDVVAALGHHNAAGEEIVNSCLDTVTDRHCVTCDTDIAQDHELDWNYVEATCLEYGHTLEYCQRCDYKKMINIEVSLGKGEHKPSDWYTTIDPTYTTEGLEERKCTICGEVIDTRPLPVLPGLFLNMSIDNAVISGTQITDSSLIAVTVAVSGNSVPTNGVFFKVDYDADVLVYDHAEWLTTGLYDESANRAVDNEDEGHVNVIAVAPRVENQVQNYEINGTEKLVVLYFRVNYVNGESMIVDYESALTFSDCEAINKNAEDLIVMTEGATFTIAKFMDVNRDGKVGLADVQLMFKMITGEAGFDYSAVADINKDGFVDLTDVEAVCDYMAEGISYDDVRKMVA